MEKKGKPSFDVVNHNAQGIVNVQKDTSQGIIRDSPIDIRTKKGDYWNNRLSYISNTVGKSPTASACMTVIKDFVEGKGLNKTDIMKQSMNSDDDRLRVIHQGLANDISYSHRIALFVRKEVRWAVDENGKRKSYYVITEVQHLPVEYVRYSDKIVNGKVDKVVVNPYYNTIEERNYIPKEYFLYTSDDKLTTKRINSMKMELRNSNEGYWEVYYKQMTTEVDRTYSYPTYFTSGEDAMRVEASAWKYHDRNLENNFFGGALVSVNIDGDDVVKSDENGNAILTAGESFKQEYQSYFTGAKSAGASMIVFTGGNTTSEMKDIVSVTPFNPNDSTERGLDILNYTRSFLPTIMSVSPLLAGIEVSGKLGDSKEKEGAIKFQNEKTRRHREMLNDCYNTILPKFEVFYGTLSDGDIEVVPTEEYIIPPDYIWNSLTDEQKQKYLTSKHPEFV